MKCYIKRIGNPTCFEKNLGKNINHWTPQREAKLFDSVAIAKAAIKLYSLKNVEILKVKKGFINE